jgi:hypothetical protein
MLLVCALCILGKGCSSHQMRFLLWKTAVDPTTGAELILSEMGMLRQPSSLALAVSGPWLMARFLSLQI